MSERVRTAMALDAIDDVVDRCCEVAVEQVRTSGHLQVELKYDIFGAVNEASVIYGVDLDNLLKEAWVELRNRLDRTLRGVCEVAYVKPYQKDGMTVGMQAKVYRF